jgi:hypothetical protein
MLTARVGHNHSTSEFANPESGYFSQIASGKAPVTRSPLSNYIPFSSPTSPSIETDSISIQRRAPSSPFISRRPPYSRHVYTTNGHTTQTYSARIAELEKQLKDSQNVVQTLRATNNALRFHVNNSREDLVLVRKELATEKEKLATIRTLLNITNSEKQAKRLFISSSDAEELL